MDLYVELTTQAIEAASAAQPAFTGQTGAVAEFRGLVRDQEDGRLIAALEYEAYSPMAERTMRRLAQEIASRHECLAVRIVHRVGVIPVGETAIHLVVAARHRAPAFAFLAEFMDRLKQDVPIWKLRALDPAGNPATVAPPPSVPPL